MMYNMIWNLIWNWGRQLARWAQLYGIKQKETQTLPDCMMGGMVSLPAPEIKLITPAGKHSWNTSMVGMCERQPTLGSCATFAGRQELMLPPSRAQQTLGSCTTFVGRQKPMCPTSCASENLAWTFLSAPLLRSFPVICAPPLRSSSVLSVPYLRSFPVLSAPLLRSFPVLSDSVCQLHTTR